MKVKCVSDNLVYVDLGEEYEAEFSKSATWQFLVTDNSGRKNTYHKSHFEVIIDEPKIEVGSEWVSESGVVWIVKYVNKYVILNKDSMEICVGVEKFFSKYKPKPKTVTMYFHENSDGGYMALSYKTLYPVLFTREIELP